MNNKHNAKCFMNYLGEYCMEINAFNQMARLILSNQIVIEANQGGIETGEAETRQTPNGTLIIPIHGMMMKTASSFGGTSTTAVRRVIRNSMHDDEVMAVILDIDTAGGTVDGTDELARDIKALAEVKPVHTHVSGMLCSAGYWIGSQANSISATRMSTIGSLGTVLTVQDFSKAFEKEGITTHVISTGKFKGMGEPGSEITPDHLKFLQKRVNEMNKFFMDAVAEARNFSKEEVADLFDGSFELAGKAMKQGLIDEINSFENVLARIDGEAAKKAAEEAATMARLRVNSR